MVYERAVGVGGKIDHSNTMYINGENIYDRGVLVESFKVGGTPIKNEVYQGRNRTHFNVLASVFGLRDISISLFFSEATRRELTLKKSAIDSLMFGKTELLLPDGFFYTSTLTKPGEMAIVGQQRNKLIALCKYEFSGIRHDSLVSASGNTIYCASTMPRTDCRLICTASESRTSLLVGTVTIYNVAAGDVIEVDGILGRILQNGAPCAGNMRFIHFPYLVPGENNLNCVETLTVEYYPTYM